MANSACYTRHTGEHIYQEEKRPEREADVTVLHGHKPGSLSSTRPGPKAGPGPESTDNGRVWFKWQQSDLIQNISGFVGLFFHKENVFVCSSAHVMSVTQSAPCTNPTYLIFSEIFVAVLCLKQFEATPYKFGTR
jgi:hypothetical protein